MRSTRSPAGVQIKRHICSALLSLHHPLELCAANPSSLPRCSHVHHATATAEAQGTTSTGTRPRAASPHLPGAGTPPRRPAGCCRAWPPGHLRPAAEPQGQALGGAAGQLPRAERCPAPAAAPGACCSAAAEGGCRRQLAQRAQQRPQHGFPPPGESRRCPGVPVGGAAARGRTGGGAAAPARPRLRRRQRRMPLGAPASRAQLGAAHRRHCQPSCCCCPLLMLLLPCRAAPAGCAESLLRR